jgi:MSHA type pilus biogenesis protein MshL
MSLPPPGVTPAATPIPAPAPPPPAAPWTAPQSSFPMPRFEAWPMPPSPPTAAPATAAPLAPAPGAPPVLPGTQDKKMYSFHAENMELKMALATFARANKLNIVPDQDVTGQVTLELQELPLERVMQALLEAHDVTWTEEGGLIRVRAHETRMFSVDYLRLTRKGMGTSSAMLSSGSSMGGGGYGGGAGGGMGGGGMGGMGGGGMGGMGGGMGGMGGSVGGSAINLTQDNSVEFWKELKEELAKILTAKGKETMAINMTAGLIQITDRPSALKNVERYLSEMAGTVQRQVDIEAKLYDVALGDQFAFGIDWYKVAVAAGGQFGTFAMPYSVSPGAVPQLTPGGDFKLKPATIAMVFTNRNSGAALTALQDQGTVSVISQPRLRTLNNQTALIKVGRDTPFFSRNVYYQPYYYGGGVDVGAANNTIVQDTYQMITIGTILSITPQIATNGSITLDISPVITSLAGTEESVSSQGGKTTAPILDIKQASTLVRVNDGDTIIMGGLIQNASAKAIRKVPIIGDIPYLGLLFQAKVDSKSKKELVIFLTPTIVP